MVKVLLYVHRNRVGLLGTGTQDVHLDYHTAPELCSINTREKPCIMCCTLSLFLNFAFGADADGLV